MDHHHERIRPYRLHPRCENNRKGHRNEVIAVRDEEEDVDVVVVHVAVVLLRDEAEEIV